MENTFDLKKFLVENKLTANSRMLKEERELEDGTLPSTYLDSYKDVTTEYLTQQGLIKYVENDEEGSGHLILRALKKKGIRATPIGEMDSDNPSDYGPEVYELYDLGDGHILSIDDYTGYPAVFTKSNNSRMLKEEFAPSTAPIQGIEDSTYPVQEAFKKAGVDMSKPIVVINSETGLPVRQNPSKTVSELEKLRQEYSENFEEGNDFPVFYEYDNNTVLASDMPEGTSYKLAVGFFEAEDYSILQ